MHSVVVLGDVRTHAYQDENQSTRTTLGGARMMKDLIDAAIERIASQSQSSGITPPNVFSYEDLTPDEIEAAIGFEVRSWSIQKKTLQESMFNEDSDSERLRLKSPPKVSERLENEPRYFLPLSEKLLWAIMPYEKIKKTRGKYTPLAVVGQYANSGVLPTHIGHFDPPDASCPWCPDIVVFDDLAGELRKIPLPESDFGKQVIPYCDAQTQSGNSKVNLSSKKQYSAVLRTILDRVALAVNPEFMRSYRDNNKKDKSDSVNNQSGGPPLEPIIICSVMGLPPELSVSKTSNKTANSSKPSDSPKSQFFWDILYADPQLRRRTVIILDAKELCESGQLAVSFGSSWESTSQDLIAEINRNPKFRRYLDFSQVILRIGYTGVLHISRRDERESLYQLYFDPCRDDTCWCDPADGVVLGQSSVFVARIVQELIQNCNLQNEHPVLQDLASLIGNAIPFAIRECQEQINWGIDADQADENERSKHYRPTDRVSCVSSISVPSYRNRSWSILSQVSQGSASTVARNIVRYGRQSALVQSVPTMRELVHSVAVIASDVLWEIISPFIEDGEDPQLSKDSVIDPQVRRELSKLAGLKFESENPKVSFSRQYWFREVISHRIKTIVRLQEKQIRELCNLFMSKQYLDKYEELAKEFATGLNFKTLRQSYISEFYDLTNMLRDKITEFERSVERFLVENLDIDLHNDYRFRPVVAPLYQIDKLVSVVDRREIEGIREVKKLIRIHMDKVTLDNNPKNHRPLSLAVFGPPGAGKSITVKGVINSLGFKDKCVELTFNLAQFSTVSDLDAAFQRIGNVSGLNKVPVVFFDEFDCRFNGEPLGWLKYLLSPMEDGVYRETPIHTAIFVFAGGTSSTYANFNLSESDLDYQKFVLAKGPDFSSRLKGQLNVVGVNPADDDDQLYLIRRAVIIRSILEQIQPDCAKQDGEAKIDDDLLRAMLFVPSYKNGARSIRKLIEMCPGSDKRLRNSALPPLQQLNMVTNGKAFLDQLDRVSEEPT